MWHFNGASSTGLAHSHSEGSGGAGRWADSEVTEEPPHLLKQDAPTQEFVLVYKEHLPQLPNRNRRSRMSDWRNPTPRHMFTSTSNVTEQWEGD